jgi:hypothetical protein
MADIIWTKVQVILTDVPIEYMDCNSGAFIDGDEVLVEFTNQEWDQPKIIGFKESPKLCTDIYVFPGQLQFKYETESRTMGLNYNSASWAWRASFPRNYNFGRIEYAATGENSLGFVACGNEVDFAGQRTQSFRDVDVFDSTTDTFSNGRSHPQAKGNLGFSSLKNGRCITSGGGLYQGVGQGIDPSQVFPDTHEYVISTNSWISKQPDRYIFDHADFVIDGVLHTVGGANLTAFPETSADSRHRAFQQLADAWYDRITCPQGSFKRVNGFNLDGKGLVGGGSLLTDFTNEIGLVDTTGETYLYDQDAHSWTQKANAVSGFGTQATATASSETIALNFGGGSAGNLTHWYDYKLSTDLWRDRGLFGLTVNDDPVWYSHRTGAAGVEL